MTNELAINLDNSINEKTLSDQEVLSDDSSNGQSISETLEGNIIIWFFVHVKSLLTLRCY